MYHCSSIVFQLDADGDSGAVVCACDEADSAKRQARIGSNRLNRANELTRFGFMDGYF